MGGRGLNPGDAEDVPANPSQNKVAFIFLPMYAGAKKLDGIRWNRGAIAELKEMALEKNPVKEKDKNAVSMIDFFEEESLNAIEKSCESEIEKQFAYGMYVVAKMEGEFINFVTPMMWENFFAQEVTDEDGLAIKNYLDKSQILVIPNMPINADGKTYRIDFLVAVRPKGKRKKKMVIIECDSFQYHSSPAALEKDKKRERALAKLGSKILRFSGREIHRNPTQIGMEALELLLEKTYG